MNSRHAHFLCASLLAAAALVAATPSSAQDTGEWLMRGRLTHLDSVNQDSTGLGLSVNNKAYAAVDITYFFSRNLAAEWALTAPQSHTLYVAASKIGSLRQMPLTLTLQYHIDGLAGWRPYLGAGIHYAKFSSVSFEPAVVTNLAPNIKRSSNGLAIALGADFPLGGGWMFNLDVKKVQMDTDVSSFGTHVGNFKLDPVLVGVGFGKRF